MFKKKANIPIRNVRIRLTAGRRDRIQVFTRCSSPLSIYGGLQFEVEADEGTAFTYVTEMLGVPESDVEVMPFG